MNNISPVTAEQLPAVPAQTSALTLDEALVQAMTNKNTSFAKVEAMVRLRRELQADLARERAEVARQVYFRSMKAAQQAMPQIIKSKENPETHSRYAPHEDIDEEIRPIYTAHGFALCWGQADASVPTKVRVICDVIHEAGHVEHWWREGTIDTTGPKGTVNKTPLHGEASAETYIKRRLLCNIFNILTYDDDDGNAGGGKVANGQSRRAPPPPPPPREPSNTWLGQAERTLNARKHKPPEWLAALITATRAAPTVADLDAFEKLVQWKLEGNAPPPEINTQIAVAFLDARKRLLAPAQNAASSEPLGDPFYLHDHYGDPVAEHLTALEFARDLVRRFEQLLGDDAAQLLENNEDEIDRARNASPAAAKLLAQTDEPPADPDTQWADEMVRTVKAYATAAAWHAGVNDKEIRARMTELRLGKPKLFRRVVDAFEQRREDLRIPQ